MTQVLSFLAAFEGGTLRFDIPRDEAERIAAEVSRQATSRAFEGYDPRIGLREILRRGFVDGHQGDPRRSQAMIQATIGLCLGSTAAANQPAAAGFIIVITRTGPDAFNFRIMAALQADAVEEMTVQLRRDRKDIIDHSQATVEAAFHRKKTPLPRDPNLDPPGRPNPARWLPALAEAERHGGSGLVRQEVRRCLDDGACFVWRSRQVAEDCQEDIDASLQAMHEYGRLRLPFPYIWAETRDWFDNHQSGQPVTRVAARFGIAAWESAEGIRFQAFADHDDHIVLSLAHGCIDAGELCERTRFSNITAVPLPVDSRHSESWHRAVAMAAQERLLELVLLLATAGVARDKVVNGGKRGAQDRRKAAQRRMGNRDYTIVRVPLHFIPGETAGGTENNGGRWVRPHIRRAHMWGKNTRPVEQQQWRDACLVGASKEQGDDVAPKTYVLR